MKYFSKGSFSKGNAVLVVMLGAAVVAAVVAALGTNTPSNSTSNAGQKIYSDAEIAAMAGTLYKDKSLPLGDNKYSTTKPAVGSIYLCNARKNEKEGGAQVVGPWVDTTQHTWKKDKKISISGVVTWSAAWFKNTITTAARTLTGNGLPTTHTTGSFPVQKNDPAYSYDKNPNSIKSQNIALQLPASPVYSNTPYCMGGEAGVMLTGVPLFNGFDALLRDAAANELQDSCDGHPEVTGKYHYHSLSACIKDTSIKTVIGYALDGFPITGPMVTKDTYLTTKNLDECHGLTSTIVVDGKKVTTYHYVMTQDFPYSVSCFRGKPVSLQAQGNGQSAGQGGTNGNTQGPGGMQQQPPQPPFPGQQFPPRQLPPQ